MQTFCRNEFNLTGLCSRHSCPLANARYATVREHQGHVYLYMKTIERAHLPSQLWEKVRLPKNYMQALKLIDDNLEFWAKFQRHKCKQRLTKIHQMLVRQRKLKISNMHTMETFETINAKQERRETKREEKALTAAKIENAIEKELLSRLQQGTYKDIYNLQQSEFEKALDEEEIQKDEYVADEISNEDESELGDNLFEDSEMGEDEMEELEAEYLEEMAQMEAQAQDSEDDEPAPKLGKRSRKEKVSVDYEYEFEQEKPQKQRKTSEARSAKSKSTASSVDF